MTLTFLRSLRIIAMTVAFILATTAGWLYSQVRNEFVTEGTILTTTPLDPRFNQRAFDARLHKLVSSTFADGDMAHWRPRVSVRLDPILTGALMVNVAASSREVSIETNSKVLQMTEKELQDLYKKVIRTAANQGNQQILYPPPLPETLETEILEPRLIKSLWPQPVHNALRVGQLWVCGGLVIVSIAILFLVVSTWSLSPSPRFFVTRAEERLEVKAPPNSN